MGDWSRAFESPVIATLATGVDITNGENVLYLNNLDVFNTLVIDAVLGNQSSMSIPLDSAAFTVILKRGGNTGTVINQYTLWLQGSWWAPANNGAFTHGDGSQSVIPLHGADTAQIEVFQITAMEDLTLSSITGTSETRAFAHSTTVQRGFGFVGQTGNGGQELLYQSTYSYASTASLLQIPFPIVDTPCRFSFLLNPTSDVSSQAFSIYGSITFGTESNGPLFIRDNVQSKNVNVGVEKVYNGTALADQTNAPVHWISLPHTLTPMYVNFDKPASGSAVIDFALITGPGIA